MKVEISTVKGFQDFLPPESIKRQKIKEIIEKNFKLYGFAPVETPVIEFDELIRGDTLPDQEDQAISDRFRLKDRAGRNLGLRYEFTFQLARIFKQNPTIKLPFRRYQIGPVFRDEPVSPTRFRQFIQCDADIIGDESSGADFECISLVSDILKELKVKDVEIQINNRKLINSIVQSVEIPNPDQVLRELDKLDKIGEDEVKANLRKITSANQIVTLFKILEKSLEFFKENAFEGAKEVQELIDKCKTQKIKITFNPFMVRGLAYYTGSIFEIRQKGKDSIASGGRFDKVVGKILGREIPAVGVSFGLERLSSLTDLKVEPQVKAVLISIFQDEETQDLLNKLRKANVPSIMFSGKPGKALEFADSYGVPYVVFIGEREISSNKFKLKDMIKGDEKLLSEKQLIQKLS